MKKYGKCQMVGCRESARCGLYRRVYLEKKIWVEVCYGHEKEIGDENVKADRA